MQRDYIERFDEEIILAGASRILRRDKVEIFQFGSQL